MNTEKLKQLIIENPELPIKFFVNGNSADDYQDAAVILDDVTIDKFHENESYCYVYSKHAGLAKALLVVATELHLYLNVYSKHAGLAKALAIFNDMDIVYFNNLAIFNDMDIVYFNNLNDEEQNKIAQKIEDDVDWTKAIIVWLERGA